MQIHLGYDAFAAARSQVNDAIAELTEAQARTSRQIGHLMDGGWSGAAADSFDDAWHDWLAGAMEVREALAQIASALASTERDLSARDEDALAQLASLSKAVQP
ncbi:MAG: WXG100 family type VII secretion target [Nocardioides sp.]